MIYHKANKEVLFIGKVINPTIEENNFKMHFYKSSDDNSTTKGRKENKGTKI